MTRPAVLRLVVCLAIGAGALVGTVPSAAAATTSSGLTVTIDALTPAAVPAKGSVTMTGQVTNDGSQRWTDLKVYLLRSPTPMTTSAQVAAAAALPDDAEPPGASRVTSPGRYAQLGNLAPGHSIGYTVSVPRRLLGLSGAPGVYWFGVQVLGTQDGVRDSLADARARTFLPLVPSKTPPVRVALVLPFVDPVHRTRNGTLVNPSGWKQVLAPDGRLDRLLSLSDTTTQPLTWLVDPALLDAVLSISDGNPPFAISGQSTGGSSPSPSPSASPSSSAGAAGSSSPTRDERNATAWLARFSAQAAQRNVLALPYGDIDVAAAVDRGHPDLVKRAVTLGARTVKKAGISASTAFAPRSGYLPQAAIDDAGEGTTVIVREEALHASRTTFLTSSGTTVVRTDAAAASGGPGPGPRLSALAMRQRILSEVALRALSPSPDRPVVVTLPFRWDPGTGWADSNFFGAFAAQPWVQLTALSGLGIGTTPPTAQYPTAVRRAALPATNIRASERLEHDSSVLSNVLTGNHTAGNQVAKAGLLAATQQSRVRQRAAARQADQTHIAMGRLLRRVTIDGPPFVMMSSERGPIQVTLVNQLTVTVTVTVRAEAADSELSFAAPSPVTIAAGARAPVRLRVVGHQIGVHVVTVQTVDRLGNPLGASVSFNVRTSQVGQIVWVIIAAGAVLLFGAIGVRLVRRFRRSRKGGEAPQPQSDGSP